MIEIPAKQCKTNDDCDFFQECEFDVIGMRRECYTQAWAWVLLIAGPSVVGLGILVSVLCCVKKRVCCWAKAK